MRFTVFRASQLKLGITIAWICFIINFTYPSRIPLSLFLSSIIISGLIFF